MNTKPKSKPMKMTLNNVNVIFNDLRGEQFNESRKALKFALQPEDAKSVDKIVNKINKEEFDNTGHNAVCKTMEDGTVLYKAMTYDVEKVCFVDGSAKRIKSDINFGSGANLNLIIKIKSYDSRGQKGIKAYLEGIQILSRGGNVVSEDDFEKVEGAYVASETTQTNTETQVEF